MRDWLELYRSHLRLGVSEETALRRTNRDWGTPAWTERTERNAIREELHAQAKIDERNGVPLALRRYRSEQWRSSYLVAYPDLEALGQAVAEQDFAQAEAYCRKVIHIALTAHRTRYLNLGLQSAAEAPRLELFYEAIGHNALRFSRAGTLDDIRRLFYKLLPSEIAKLPEDDFRRTIEAHLL
jgi:hypothetical protein